MGQQHQLLAIKDTRQAALAAMVSDTQHKFSKVDQFFRGEQRSLQMLVQSPENEALQRASATKKELATTVIETLNYMLGTWASTEDVLFQINKTNQLAKADLYFREQLLVKDVPVEHLLGMEGRIEALRKTLVLAPTLDASKAWEIDIHNSHKGAWKLREPEQVLKTAKTTKAVTLYEATDKHPAQIEKVSEDITVGVFSDHRWSGALSSKQKADLLAVCDDLLVEIKKARMQANTQEASKDTIGDAVTALFLSVLK